MLPRYEIKNPQQLVRILLAVILFLVSVIGINLKDYFFLARKQPVSIENYLIEKKQDLDYTGLITVSQPPVQPEGSNEPNKKPSESGQVASVTQNLKLYLGFAIEPITTNRISEVESQIGHKFDLLMGYIQWGNPNNFKLTDHYLNNYTSTHKTPIISWEPWDPNRGVEQAEYKLANITAGNFDSYIREFASSMKKYNKPIFLRFAHEMNGNWYPWGGTVNGNSATDFQNAWRHTYNLFQQEGANNVNWIWSPDATSYPRFNGNAISDYYPGDSYVDWIGLDGYNWGPTKVGKSWESFDSIFAEGYKSVLGYNKPIMIAEFSSTEAGGNKAGWIEETFLNSLPKKFPLVKAIVWFSINRETSWDIASSLNSVESFKKVANSGIFADSVQFLGSKITTP